MRDYAKSKIYKIESISRGDVGDCYYGSTTEEYLSQRFAHHRTDYRNWKDGKGKYCMSSFILFEKYGLEDCQIVLLENLENCKSKNELHAREAFYIRNYKCVNKQIPLRTKKEYYEDNKQTFMDNIKQYHYENKEQITEYQKEYRKLNKEKAKEYSIKYRQEHNEEKKANDKKYRQKHNEDIKAYNKVTFICECGSKCTVVNKLQHFRTKKHQSFTENV